MCHKNHMFAVIVVLGVVGTLLLGGCVASTAPEGWLETPNVQSPAVYGGWIHVRVANQPPIMGELLAVGTDTLYMLTATELTTIPLQQIRRATVTMYQVTQGQEVFVLWTLLGAASSVTHGFGFVISGPAWFLIGTLSTIGYLDWPTIRYPQHEWEALRQYARFPQGMPHGLDRSTLQRKSSG